MPGLPSQEDVPTASDFRAPQEPATSTIDTDRPAAPTSDPPDPYSSPSPDASAAVTNRPPRLPFPVPQHVQIRTIEDDVTVDGAEHEVSTVADIPREARDVIDTYLGEDSVTRKAPPLPLDLYDGPDAITMQARVVADHLVLPLKEDEESVTAKAPRHLTNILRVIAADRANGDASTLEAPARHQTAVMPNAPIRPATAVSPASASESVLRSVVAPPSSERGMSAADPVASGQDAFPSEPKTREIDLGKSPRYGLLVAAVAAVSVSIPIFLFIFLSRDADDYVPSASGHTTSVRTLAPDDLNKRGDPLRGKIDKSKPATSASASGSASANVVTSPKR